MFLLILEDGSIRKTASVSDETLSACDDGYCSVINLNTDQPMDFHKGEWADIEEV